MSVSLNKRQMKSIPVPITRAKLLLVEFNLSEKMATFILRRIVVGKLHAGGLEVKPKHKLGHGGASIKKQKSKRG
jgi:hypothetical protein